MSNVQEALKAAIEEIENYGKFLSSIGILIDTNKSTKAVEQCKAALAEIAKCEPFGYFKAEPFGWTDCAETDEGAIALYELPQPREWVGLTYKDKVDLRENNDWYNYPNDLIEATEAKLKQLNSKG